MESTLARLDLRHKVAQMVVPWVGGGYLAVGTEEYERLTRWVRDDGVGGVVVSIGPPMEVASKLNMLQREAAVPLIVATDMEHGPGQRLNGAVVFPYGLEVGGGTEFPPVMGIGASGDTSLAYAMGRVTAEEARAVGIHMDYGPDADVNNNPDNPIINTRSYGGDPEAVARMVAAHVHGLQDNGMLATAKHFPGHGDTGTDSHLALPIIEADPARVDTVELVPFRAAVRAGVHGVMSAHIAFPALTGDTIPATLSPALLGGLLQDSLGFDGLVVTDALDMGAVVSRYGAERVPVMAVKAGADVLLMPPDVESAIDAVVSAVRSGEIPESRIDRSVRKILRSKAQVGLDTTRTVDLDAVPRRVGTPDHLAVARRAAEASLTVARDRDGLLPVTGAARPLSIVYSDDADPYAGRALQAALSARFPGLTTVRLERDASPEAIDSVRAMADSADAVFVSLFVRVMARKGGVAVPERVAGLVEELARSRRTVVTSFGNPYLLRQMPDVGTYVLAWGPEDVLQQAAARGLTGEAPMTGRLPIDIPPFLRVGDGVSIGAAAAPGAPPPGAAERLPVRRGTPGSVGMSAAALDSLDALVVRGIRGGVAPGVAMAIGRHGVIVRERGYGQLDWDPSPRVSAATLYDLASLTKVIATTTAVMILYDEGRIDLDAPVTRYLREWEPTGAKARVTVRDLLTHTAGLPAWLPLYRELSGREAYYHRIGSLALEYPPGTKTVYSDLGMIMVQAVVERVSGEPIEDFVRRRVWAPLGMTDTRYSPLQVARSEQPRPAGRLAQEEGSPAGDDGEAAASLVDVLARTAPTERDSTGELIRGYVHDENARAMGGVSGHAGLFSSARDLAVFAQMLLNGGVYQGRRIVADSTVRYFTQRQGGSSRALGWDTPSPGSSAGAYFSASSFGHTGFTGTSLWIDPERDLFVVLLANRVDPTRENQKHIPFRRSVHDAVIRAITDADVQPRPDSR